jgi:prephenate dehydrogenase
MKFERIAVLGPGLLGGSIALAVRQRGLAQEIALWGRSEHSLSAARQARVTRHLHLDIPTTVRGADLVVICTPVGVIEKVAAEVKPALRQGAVITDVGSVKEPVVATLDRIFGKSIHWVGSHPMAGSERSGFAAARADLFEGSTAIVTPTKRSSRKAVRVVRAFWHALGCKRMTLDPARHDELVAQISHLPHLAAAALVNVSTDSGRQVVGNGFRDTTRVAAGPPAMWTDILLSNKRGVAKALKQLIQQLRDARRCLDADDEKGLHHLLASAHHLRSSMIDPRRRSPKPKRFSR